MIFSHPPFLLFLIFSLHYFQPIIYLFINCRKIFILPLWLPPFLFISVHELPLFCFQYPLSLLPHYPPFLSILLIHWHFNFICFLLWQLIELTFNSIIILLILLSTFPLSFISLLFIPFPILYYLASTFIFPLIDLKLSLFIHFIHFSLPIFEQVLIVPLHFLLIQILFYRLLVSLQNQIFSLLFLISRSHHFILIYSIPPQFIIFFNFVLPMQYSRQYL